MFGEWLPDLPAYGHDGLVTCRNVIPGPNGYEPVKTLSEIRGALPYTWLGGGVFNSNGTQALLAWTTNGLYADIAAAWVSKYAAAYTLPGRMIQFGDLVIILNGGAPVKYTIATAAGAVLAGSPPSSSMGAVVDPGFIFLAGNSSNRNRVYWSGLETAEGWTVGTNQCDYQDIPDGGPITGLAGGQTGLVFQANQINEFTYTAGDVIFARRTITRDVGCIAAGSVIQVGPTTFFLSRRGFYALSDGQLDPIGEGKVDMTFLNAYTASDLEANMRCAVDPVRQVVMWSLTDKLWIYHYGLRKWADVVIPGLVGVQTGATSSTTLEAIAVAYPAIESVPLSFDDPSWNGGTPFLGIVKSDKKIYTFGSSTNMAASLCEAKRENVPARETIVRFARLIGDATSGATVNIAYSMRLGDTPATKSASSTRASGRIPVRCRGKVFQTSVDLAEGATWTYLQGIELEGTGGGAQ